MTNFKTQFLTLFFCLTLTFSSTLYAQIDANSLMGLPQGTTAEINSIVSPEVGSLVYNTTIGSVMQYTSSGWENVSAGAQSLSFDGTNLTISDGNSVDISVLSGADNLGDHTASQNIQLNSNWLSNDGGSEGIYIENDGDVGIGTSSPSGQFHVLNTGNVDGFLFRSTNVLTGEKDVLTIEDQDVGGGGQDHSSVLKVLKSANINSGDLGFSLLEMTYTGSDPGASKYWLSGRKTDESTPEWGVSVTDNQIWSSGGILLNATGSTNGSFSGGNFIVEADGDVGVGTNTPDARLDVEGGSVRFSNYGSGSYTSGANQYLLGVQSDGDIMEIDPSTLGGGSSADNLGDHIGTQNIQLSDFWLSNDGGNEGIRVDDSGQVGIGVSAPTHQLTVYDLNGSTDLTGDNEHPVSKLAYRSSDYANFWPDFSVTMGGLGLYGLYGSDTSLEKLGGVYGQFGSIDCGHLIFTTVVNNVETERMVITESGLVGINTSTPTSYLEVNGGIEANAYYYTSDSLKKEQIKVLDSPLDKALNLRPVSYYWKKSLQTDKGFGSAKQIGFLAQEVKAILPEAVLDNKEHGMAIDYGKLTPILIGAVQEQQELIDQQAQKIADLEKQLSLSEENKKRVDQLEQELQQIKDLLRNKK